MDILQRLLESSLQQQEADDALFGKEDGEQEARPLSLDWIA